MRPRLDVALVGCGHMGSHHARTVLQDPRCRLVAVVDVQPGRARQLADRCGCEARGSVPEGVDAVIVATTTSAHVEVGARQVQAGRWCLVEKPLAPSVEQARRLVGPRTWVGHSERWNPAWSGPPRRWQHVHVERCGPPSDRGRDVDVVLDLMLHDLDLMRPARDHLPQVQVVRGVRADDGVLDALEVVLRWHDGASARVLASRRARWTRRTWQAYDADGYGAWDLARGTSVRRDEAGGDALERQWSTLVRAALDDEPLPWNAEEGVVAVAWAQHVQRAVVASGV